METSMKNKIHIDSTVDLLQCPEWAGFLLNDRIVSIPLNRPGGQAVFGGRFPCPGEAPSNRGVPPLHELLASPGAPREDTKERIESLRLQIENGTYLTDEIIERTADKFLKSKSLRHDDEDK
jgi:hypothetical protein